MSFPILPSLLVEVLYWLRSFIISLSHLLPLLLPAERLWSRREAISSGNITLTALPRLHYFRCLLNRRGVEAAPVLNKYAREPPIGPRSCYVQ